MLLLYYQFTFAADSGHQAGNGEACSRLFCHKEWGCPKKDLQLTPPYTDDALARKAGYICDGFPWYNGGFPLTDLHYDNEMEEYKCLEKHQSGVFCEKWSTIESSETEWEYGICECIKSGTRNNSC